MLPSTKFIEKTRPVNILQVTNGELLRRVVGKEEAVLSFPWNSELVSTVSLCSLPDERV